MRRKSRAADAGQLKARDVPVTALAAIIACTTWSSAAAAFTLRRAVEPPPAIYSTGPTQTGKTWEMRLRDVAQVDYICSLPGGAPKHSASRSYYWGCYSPRLDAVILVDPAAWPSRREWDELRAHEWAHARGWRHYDDGRGTDWVASLPPQGGRAYAAIDAAEPASAIAPPSP